MQAREQARTQRRIGWGSLALALSIAWFLFNRTDGHNPSVADRLVTILGGRAWLVDNGRLHYTLFYTMPIPLLAIAIGFRFPKNFGATVGRNTGILLGLFLTIPGILPSLLVDDLNQSC